jgi:hypothetical protein
MMVVNVLLFKLYLSAQAHHQSDRNVITKLLLLILPIQKHFESNVKVALLVFFLFLPFQMIHRFNILNDTKVCTVQAP